MHDKGDLVKVVDGIDEDSKLFIGQIGTVAEVYEDHDAYPYYVEFSSNIYRRFNEEIGGLLWRQSDLEGI